MFEIQKPIKDQWIITLGFGEKVFYGIHEGLDLKTKCKKYKNGIGMPIYACADGEWWISKKDKKAGNMIILYHAKGYESRYYHLSKSNFKKGWTKVKTGDCIGYSGDTGKWCIGAHLHFEIKKNNKPINPLDLIGEHIENQSDYKKQIILKANELIELAKKL